jgi:hypothetical protein
MEDEGVKPMLAVDNKMTRTSVKRKIDDPSGTERLLKMKADREEELSS